MEIIMAEYKELIKNFNNLRSYLRDFFVYGFCSRNDYASTLSSKSARTYDNERRRIESYLKDYIESTYQSHEKQTAIIINPSEIEQNPLYCIWKAKTFTSNDITLHFFILDYLLKHSQTDASTLCDKLSEEYGIIFELQTVRNKLKEYKELGLLSSKKNGRQLFYFLTEQSDILSSKVVVDMIKFYQEAAPFGFLGSTILEKYNESNQFFRFKHAFLVHTLEDQILYDCISSIHFKQRIEITIKNRFRNKEYYYYGIPLQIFVSTQTGRRYLCLYKDKSFRFSCQRLDYIINIKILEPAKNYEQIQEALARNRPKCWGVTFGNHTRNETVHMILFIHLPEEIYILNRLKREGRGGTITQLSENKFEYTGEFFDAREMLTWIKTFTGRIISFQCSNRQVVIQLYSDFIRMGQMYLNQENEEK